MKYFFLSLCILVGSFFLSTEKVFAVINLNPATTTVSMSINALNTQNGTIGFRADVMNTGIIPTTPTYNATNTLSVNTSGVASTSFSGLTAGGSYLVQIKSYPLSDPFDLSLDQEKPFQTQAQSPTLTALSVTSGNQGQVMTVNMTGTNFVNGATANFGANISNTITFVSPTLLKANIIIANNASAGPRAVTVTSGGNTTAPKVFNVVANQGTAFTVVGASPAFTAEQNDPNLAHVTMTVTFNGDPMSAPAAGITLVTSTDNPATTNTVYNGPVTGSAQTITGNSYAIELSNVPLNTTYSYIIKNATTGATMYGPKTFTASLNTTTPPTDACPNEPGIQPTGPCNTTQNDVCTNQPGIQPPGTQCQTVLYTLLEPIMGVTAINTASDLATFFNFLFKMLIGLCSLLAVIMIIIGGIEYLTTEAFTGKSNARERIENAVTGLVLLAAVYLILYTINPNLLRLNIDLKAIETHIDGVTLADIEFNSTFTSSGSCSNGKNLTAQDLDCPTCKNLSDASVPIFIPYKVGPAGTYGTLDYQVEDNLRTRLKELRIKLQAVGIASNSNTDTQWKVTESWKPSRQHCNDCHYKGTCVDANFYNISPTVENIRKFMQAAKDSNLIAVYEVQNDARKQELQEITTQFGDKSVLNLGTWISGEHFSVYKK